MAYVTDMGGHDAEWLLQRELSIHDSQMRAARRGKKQVRKEALSVERLGPVLEITQQDIEKVTGHVRDLIPDPAEAAEVLQMLGLDEPLALGPDSA